jgi:hypothetical protein
VRLRLLPLLKTQRELYAMPRGMERFRAYLQTMTGGGDDVHLPLMAMNPMGKPHCAALLDGLLALDGEAVAGSALDEAAPRLHAVDGDFDVARWWSSTTRWAVGPSASSPSARARSSAATS